MCGNKQRETREIEYGVPQGWILGPIQFSLYINDLPINIMRSKIVLFADDTNILVSEANMNNLQYKINNFMNELQTWFTLNSLVVKTLRTGDADLRFTLQLCKSDDANLRF